MKKTFMFPFTIYVFLILFIWPCKMITAQLIKEPKPTHMAKKFVRLVKVNETSEDIDNEHFMAKARSLTLDDAGNLYVYDALLTRIFKFDKDYRFVKSFGKNGRGPGEISKCMGHFKISFSQNRYLNVSDIGNRKIIVFDKNGGLITELRLPHTDINRDTSLPVVDKMGNYFILSAYGGSVDKFNAKGERIHTFLSKEHYNRFVLYRPKTPEHPLMKKMNMLLLPVSINTSYDILPANRLLIYLHNSSTVYIFEGNELVKKIDIWPKSALESFQFKVDTFLKPTALKNRHYHTFMFNTFFVDKDNGNYFYLNEYCKKNKINSIYKFNLKGDLVEVLQTKESVVFYAKRNRLFYGLFRGKIKIFKEE